VELFCTDRPSLTVVTAEAEVAAVCSAGGLIEATDCVTGEDFVSCDCRCPAEMLAMLTELGCTVCAGGLTCAAPAEADEASGLEVASATPLAGSSFLPAATSAAGADAVSPVGFATASPSGTAVEALLASPSLRSTCFLRFESTLAAVPASAAEVFVSTAAAAFVVAATGDCRAAKSATVEAPATGACTGAEAFAGVATVD